MQKAIWLCCAFVLACSGGAGRAVVEGDGGLTGARVGRGTGGDARTGEVRSMLAPDLALAVDALAADVLAADTTIPVDALLPVDVQRPADTSPDGQPWGRVDDAGVLHCKYQNGTGGGRDTLEDCNYVLDLVNPTARARCKRVITGVPASCRWGLEGESSWAWFVNECGDCAGLEKWTSVPGGVL